jgi:hypothetical protein
MHDKPPGSATSSLDDAMGEVARLAASSEPQREERVLAATARALSLAGGGGETLQVALLRLVDGEEFTFAWPLELRPGNRFPARTSLAWRALRSGPLIENEVPKRPHFSLYERIPREGEVIAPIQRMLALPIPGEGGPVGVAQLSRTGETAALAGPGFTRADAERVADALKRLAPSLTSAWTTAEG